MSHSKIHRYAYWTVHVIDLLHSKQRLRILQSFFFLHFGIKFDDIFDVQNCWSATNNFNATRTMDYL